MHVAMLSSQRAYYGGEVHLLELARGLHQRGHRVSCLVRTGGALASRLAEAGLEVHPQRLRGWLDPPSIVQLARRLRTLGPDILHSHSPRDYYLAAIASCGSDARNVGTRHQLHPITLPRLKRPFLGRFQAMIAVSEAVCDGLIASGLDAARVVTVPNGVRLPVRREDPAALRASLGVAAGDGPVIGFVGRLCPTKGPDVLLRAAARLRGRWPGLLVVLVGDDADDGAYVRWLETLAGELRLDARFCGYQPDAARLLPAFDLFAVPSQAEPFGLVTLEALARGVPLVATRSGGSREIVRDGREGLLVPPADPEALAGAIHRLLADHALRARCVAAGPRRVAARFTLAQQVSATERVYAKVLAGAPLPADLRPDGVQSRTAS